MIRSIRFSSVSGRPGQEHHTLEIQRASVKRAAPNGAYELVDVLRDEDQSGGSRIRPQVGSALARILAGAADAIILWRASRCSRNWRAAVEGEADWELPSDTVVGVIAAGHETSSARRRCGRFLATGRVGGSRRARRGRGWQAAPVC